MPERIARIVQGIQHLFEDLGVADVEERVLRFIVQEIHAGKTFAEALEEPYVKNNTKPEWRREILQRPEIAKAVDEEMERVLGDHGGGEGK